MHLQNLNLNILKNKCACNSPNSTIDFEENGLIVFPNPVVDYLYISEIFNIKIKFIISLILMEKLLKMVHYIMEKYF